MDAYNNEPLVSVIMSVYNTRKAFLHQAIQSIADQTYKNIEYIIVNDGSTLDETNEALENAASKYSNITLLYNEHNVGLTKSLNRAIACCGGKYIARMDADDISLADRIHEQVRFMECNSDVVLCGTDIVGFDKETIFFDSSIEYYRCSNPMVRAIHLVFENEGFAHPTFMLRSDFLLNKSILYREDMPHAQDYGLTTDCILSGGKISIIKKPLLLYRVHEDQITRKSYDSQIECQARIAYSRIKETFSTLDEIECWAIARLNHESLEYKPNIYINAIKKIIKENTNRHLFDDYLLRREYRYEWYRKYMRITRMLGKPWGLFHWFSISSFPVAMTVKIKDAILAKIYSLCYSKKRKENAVKINLLFAELSKNEE